MADSLDVDFSLYGEMRLGNEDEEWVGGNRVRMAVGVEDDEWVGE